MGNGQYLWSVAKALRTRVRPCVADHAARDALDNSVRVLTCLASVLEPGPPLPTGFADLAGPADTDRLRGPAENLAATRSTGQAIAQLARRIDAGTPLSALREAVFWEKHLLDEAMARIEAVERAAPAQVSEGGSISPERLQAYLRHRPESAAATVRDFRLVVGGRSRQTAIFTAADGGDLPTEMVIQRGIPGQAAGAGFLDEAQQYALLRRLHEAGLRVPRPLLVETQVHWLDAGFLLVERAPGSPAQADYWLPVDNTAVVLDLARQMALLHAQPVDVVGQGLPVARVPGDAAAWRQEVEALAEGWTQAAHWPSLTMSGAIDWLRAHADMIDDRCAIVHNDMVFHNILAQDGAITAVLDWEQCAIGHPGEDLGYCYPAVIAVMDWATFMAAYRGAGGADIPQHQIDFFALRACLRLMGLVLRGGRDSFEGGLTDDVLVASAGAHFSQRLLHRMAVVLESIMARAS